MVLNVSSIYRGQEMDLQWWLCWQMGGETSRKKASTVDTSHVSDDTTNYISKFHMVIYGLYLEILFMHNFFSFASICWCGCLNCCAAFRLSEPDDSGQTEMRSQPLLWLLFKDLHHIFSHKKTKGWSWWCDHLLRSLLPFSAPLFFYSSFFVLLDNWMFKQ